MNKTICQAGFGGICRSRRRKRPIARPPEATRPGRPRGQSEPPTGEIRAERPLQAAIWIVPRDGKVLFNSRAPWGARLTPLVALFPMLCFNSRAPWGARPAGAKKPAAAGAFQFTRPVGGATMPTHRGPQTVAFQFTRPVGGATEQSVRDFLAGRGFNSRAPWGARPARWRRA